MNAIRYTLDGRTVELSLQDIQERLGPFATEQDAQAFAKAWNTRFYDTCDNGPDLSDAEDRDATWKETLELAGLLIP